MKILIINGSPHEKGNTRIAIDEMVKIFNNDGIESEILTVGSKAVRGCTACGSCSKTGRCVFDGDDVNKAAKIFEESAGLIIASPVYYASANGTLISFLDRLFMSSKFDKTMKVGACVAVARRGGISSTFDELNKYFTISGMPVVSSQYWNGVHGRVPGDANEDQEGLQTMRTLARNTVFLIKSIELGLDKFGLPVKEDKISTSFVR